MNKKKPPWEAIAALLPALKVAILMCSIQIAIACNVELLFHTGSSRELNEKSLMHKIAENRVIRFCAFWSTILELAFPFLSMRSGNAEGKV